ncbi:hypothetical protein [Streptomyces sp. NBC_00212]|uniref:hypothetical protein n=1 Tax=Streptomyces sp. NBC_00212 TaxID=2975684 RepID=UPI003245205E
MNTSTTVSWVTDPISAVRHAQTLHGIDGCWTRDAVERLVDAHPDWKIRREFSDLLVVGLEPSERHAGLGPELFFDKRAPKSPDVGRVRLPLIEFDFQTTPAERAAALQELAAVLSGIGRPTPVPAAANGFGLRWQSNDRTMLLQSNDRRAWVSIQPVEHRAEHLPPDLLNVVAALVPLLHDSAAGTCDRSGVEDQIATMPGWSVEFDETRALIRTADPDGQVILLGAAGHRDRYSRLQLHSFATAPALEQRRNVFGELFRSVCGVIGEPTILGGGPSGPDVRWRPAGSRARVLRLRADDRHIWIETGPAAELEDEELTTFEHGGFGGPSEPSDFPYLPYTWQLVHLGPGDTAEYLPGGRLALTLPHLQEALETLVKVWIEQLPVQQPGKKATFTIASSGIKGGLSFAYDTAKGILLRIGSRVGDPIDVAAEMSTLGWEASGTRWKAEFKNPTESNAGEVAALIVGELAARGLTDPLDLVAKRIAIGPHGFLRTTGLGITSG